MEYSEAINILELWISKAIGDAMAYHRIQFWVLLDILRGVVVVPKKIATEAVDFIKINLKDCNQKSIVLESVIKKLAHLQMMS